MIYKLDLKIWIVFHHLNLKLGNIWYTYMYERDECEYVCMKEMSVDNRVWMNEMSIIYIKSKWENLWIKKFVNFKHKLLN